MKTKGDYQVRVHSDQMVLMIVRQGGWGPLEQWPKKNLQIAIRLEPTQIRWFSQWSGREARPHEQ